MTEHTTDTGNGRRAAHERLATGSLARWTRFCASHPWRVVLGWLAIHGVTELGALVLFAAGGLVIAEKILFPGRYSRLENLALHGRLAAQMAVGAVLMLFVAAILEGGFRELVASTPWRFAIGVGVGALWVAYFCSGGRGRRP